MTQKSLASAVHLESMEWTIIWVLYFPKIMKTILRIALKFMAPEFPY